MTPHSQELNVRAANQVSLTIIGGRTVLCADRQDQSSPVVFEPLNKAEVRDGFYLADPQITDFCALSAALFHLSYQNPINSN